MPGSPQTPETAGELQQYCCCSEYPVFMNQHYSLKGLECGSICSCLCRDKFSYNTSYCSSKPRLHIHSAHSDDDSVNVCVPSSSCCCYA